MSEEARAKEVGSSCRSLGMDVRRYMGGGQNYGPFWGYPKY